MYGKEGSLSVQDPLLGLPSFVSLKPYGRTTRPDPPLLKERGALSGTPIPLPPTIPLSSSSSDLKLNDGLVAFEGTLSDHTSSSNANSALSSEDAGWSCKTKQGLWGLEKVAYW